MLEMLEYNVILQLVDLRYNALTPEIGEQIYCGIQDKANVTVKVEGSGIGISL